MWYQAASSSGVETALGSLRLCHGSRAQMWTT
jgi:hypothetical protein